MDKTDYFLLKRLLENSRVTYRELADMTNISVSAVHKRIKYLEDEGFINTFIARPSSIALKYLTVIIFGTSTSKSMDELREELGQHESVFYIAIAGAKYVYVSAFLRDISELQEFGNYVSKTAQISEPTIGILNMPYLTMPEPLTNIDFKILKTLNRDARKPITDIADDVGLSAKTVRKRLDRMIENGLVSFTLELTVHKIIFMTVFHLYLNEGTSLNATIEQMYQKFSENIVYCLSYSNIPNFLTLHTWSINTQESQKIQEELLKEGFKDVIPHIFLNAKWYECWVDKLVRSK